MSRRPRITPASVRGRPATWEDLDEVPEGYLGEIVAGEIVETPRPDAPHMQATADLAGQLWGPFRRGIGGPGGWLIYEEPRIRFGDEIRVPDLAGWRRERWTPPPRHGPLTLIPDWICEVLSPTTEREDRAAKMPLYARSQIAHLWIVSPEAHTLEVYRLQSGSWLLVTTHAGDVRVRAEPFDAADIDLSLLWFPEPPAEEE